MITVQYQITASVEKSLSARVFFYGNDSIKNNLNVLGVDNKTSTDFNKHQVFLGINK